ncbi:MAG: HAD family phosphatase [Acidimicrobiales bacterium]|nr:HAD family phosphatase [Acidimicrobiales bacterium]
MPAVSLVVTDLDGTLWHTDDRVDPTVVAAVAELEARGIPLLVATGRRVTSAREPLARIGLTPPAVVLNGALGLDLATGDRFHRAAYSNAEAVDVLAAFAEVGLRPVVYVDHPEVDVFLADEPSTHPLHVEQLGTTAATDDLERVVAEETVLGFSMIGVPWADAEAASGAVGDRAEVHLDRSLDYESTASLTVAPRGQSKWDGVAAFCAIHRLDPSGVLALADGPNDIELLDRAAVRLVPEVAHPVALERADHVIPAAADGGWAAVLDHLA